jgi:hypothetical protein
VDTSGGVVTRIKGTGIVIVTVEGLIYTASPGIARFYCAGIAISTIHRSGIATSNGITTRKVACISSARNVGEYASSSIVARVLGAYIVIIASYRVGIASSCVVATSFVTQVITKRTVDRDSLASNIGRY